MKVVFSYKKYKEAIEHERPIHPLLTMLLDIKNNVDYSSLDGQEAFPINNSSHNYRLLDGYIAPEEWCDIYPDEEPIDYSKKKYKVDGNLILEWHKKRFADIMEEKHLDIKDVVNMDEIVAADGKVAIYDPHEYNFYVIDDKGEKEAVRFAWLKEVK